MAQPHARAAPGIPLGFASQAFSVARFKSRSQELLEQLQGQLGDQTSNLEVDVRPDTIWQEFLVLGSQRLSVLRDAISCPADANLAALNLTVPSAFFYIEGVFYNDMRKPGSRDYSANIRQFCADHDIKPPVPPPADPPASAGSRQDGNRASGSDAASSHAYRTAKMEDTAFRDLYLRIGGGAGYVFCHLGCCEHLLIIRDVRRCHIDDPASESAYPLLTFQKRKRRRECTLCTLRPALKVTYNDATAPMNPCFWCDVCYNAMHYDANGSLLDSTYQVFPYQFEQTQGGVHKQ
ncbi:hypothetical protein WJX72_007223 [[Myrmecia] bisecta]|uniref:snRNA-activating protein complex subunit 3 n=1 Tax=[Myrmecia] bisecta TaxID=41462 RepID=A0AAW1Q6Z8_9CHLO